MSATETAAHRTVAGVGQARQHVGGIEALVRCATCPHGYRSAMLRQPVASGFAENMGVR